MLNDFRKRWVDILNKRKGYNTWSAGSSTEAIYTGLCLLFAASASYEEGEEIIGPGCHGLPGDAHIQTHIPQN